MLKYTRTCTQSDVLYSCVYECTQLTLLPENGLSLFTDFYKMLQNSFRQVVNTLYYGLQDFLETQIHSFL